MQNFNLSVFVFLLSIRSPTNGNSLQVAEHMERRTIPSVRISHDQHTCAQIVVTMFAAELSHAHDWYRAGASERLSVWPTWISRMT